MKHIVEYTLPYDHVVQFGVKANTVELAAEIAEELFDTGDLYNNPEVPILLDDYGEKNKITPVPEFKVVKSLPDSAQWPEPDSSVIKEVDREKAIKVAYMLVQARQCSPGKSIRFNEEMLEEAYSKALTISFDF